MVCNDVYGNSSEQYTVILQGLPNLYGLAILYACTCPYLVPDVPKISVIPEYFGETSYLKTIAVKINHTVSDTCISLPLC